MSSTNHISKEHLQALAEFRFTLRRFLQFSETSATQAGLTPQHHQLLLQIAGAPTEAITDVGYLANRLALRHHSVVELAQRCEETGHIVRKRDSEDRRHVVLELTSSGRRILRKLSAAHALELNELAPQLTHLLRQIQLQSTNLSTTEPERESQ